MSRFSTVFNRIFSKNFDKKSQNVTPRLYQNLFDKKYHVISSEELFAVVYYVHCTFFLYNLLYF